MHSNTCFIIIAQTKFRQSNRKRLKTAVLANDENSNKKSAHLRLFVFQSLINVEPNNHNDKHCDVKSKSQANHNPKQHIINEKGSNGQRQGKHKENKQQNVGQFFHIVSLSNNFLFALQIAIKHQVFLRLSVISKGSTAVLAKFSIVPVFASALVTKHKNFPFNIYILSQTAQIVKRIKCFNNFKKGY